jgi:hypothetical protein
MLQLVRAHTIARPHTSPMYSTMTADENVLLARSTCMTTVMAVHEAGRRRALVDRFRMTGEYFRIFNEIWVRRLDRP